MPPETVLSLGARIRAERLKRGIGLRELARTVGVSPSFVSQIETAKSRPSVSTLYAITSALGISVEDVFEAAPALAEAPAMAEAPAVARAASAAETLESLTALRHLPFGPVVRATERDVLVLDTGVTWERLGHLPHLGVDFLLVTYPPGGASSSQPGLMRHPGSEYGYLVSGRLVLTLGFEEIGLGPGDAVSFDSSTPHRYRNDATAPAVGVFFVVRPDEHGGA